MCRSNGGGKKDSKRIPSPSVVACRLDPFPPTGRAGFVFFKPIVSVFVGYFLIRPTEGKFWGERKRYKDKGGQNLGAFGPLHDSRLREGSLLA